MARLLIFPFGLMLGCLMAAFGQSNASVGTRPVSLEMRESEGVVTFWLRNEFKTVVSGYAIKVWAFRETSVPELVCTVRPGEVPVEQRQQPLIAVPATCTIPRDAAGNLLRYTAKLASIRADGRTSVYEAMRLGVW